jgi:hypothetical protein
MEKAASPRCSLCSGSLVQERDAWIQVGAPTQVLRYSLAWVCVECSAAFPIAAQWGLFKKSKPLYQHGKRAK